MDNEELCFLSIADLSRMIASREVSPVDVVRATIDRIARLDGTIGSYVTVLADSALEAAREAEGEIARGIYRGPLHGVPISLKDAIYMKGVRNTSGTRLMADFVADYDATVTQRLRDAGAILIGKNQMYELGMGPKTTYHFGVTRNPWDLNRVTTGSSSGSAAAVAASLCQASIGGDARGSVRGPASACGVVGLKPTFGRVSRHGMVRLSWSMDHMGHFTRTVRDCALVMNAIASYDPSDPVSVNVPVPDYAAALDGDIRGMRIGVPTDFFFDGLDPDFDAAIRKAIALLESAGATLHQVSFPSVEYALLADSVVVLAEAASGLEKAIRDSPELLGQNPRDRLELGSLLLATDYLKAQRVRALFIREYATAMKGVDVIVTPTAPCATPRFDEVTLPSDGREAVTRAANRFRRPACIVGAPSITVPCGFSSDGQPVGLQIGGRAMEDELVLRVAYAYEQLAGWHLRRPGIEC